MKPEDARPERGGFPVADDTRAHRPEASLWGQFLARGNFAEALRRVEQNAGGAGIDGMSAKGVRPWLEGPLATGPLAARRGYLLAAACPQGDDPQAFGWSACVGGAGCGGAADLPGPVAGAHAYLRPAFPSPQLRVSPGALDASGGRAGTPVHH